MMQPTLVAALVAEHHADLLRAADAHRRARSAATTTPWTTLHRRVDAIIRPVAAFRARGFASARPHADLCCA